MIILKYKIVQIIPFFLFIIIYLYVIYTFYSIAAYWATHLEYDCTKMREIRCSYLISWKNSKSVGKTKRKVNRRQTKVKVKWKVNRKKASLVAL